MFKSLLKKKTIY